MRCWLLVSLCPARAPLCPAPSESSRHRTPLHRRFLGKCLPLYSEKFFSLPVGENARSARHLDWRPAYSLA